MEEQNLAESFVKKSLSKEEASRRLAEVTSQVVTLWRP